MIGVRGLTRALIFCAIPALSGAAFAQAPQTATGGAAVYANRCAACHDTPTTRAPPRDALARLSPQRILRTLDFGLMMAVAYPMKRDEREAVAHFLGKGADDIAPPASAMCGPDRPILAGTNTGWTSWSPAPSNTRYQSADTGLNSAQVSRLQLKWAYAYTGDVTAFAAPTIAHGTLFVGSAGGMVQALNARSGCIHWTFQASGPVRAAPTVTQDEGRQLLLFSDQIGGVYALDAASGKPVWNTRVEAHESTRLSGAIAVHEGVAYVPSASWEESRAVDPAYVCCTFRGSLTALRVHDGTVLWKTWLVDEPVQTGVSAAGTPKFGPSGVGVWSAPTIDAKRGVIYLATGDNYSHPATNLSDAILALELKTGRILWSQQMLANDVFNAQCTRDAERNCGPDHDFGAPAMLVATPGGREVLVAGQKSGVVFGLDPDHRGKLLWQQRVGKGGIGGGIQWGMASDGKLAYAAVADTVRLQGDLSSQQVGNANFDPKAGGGLTALDVLSGKRVWFARPKDCAPRPGCSPAQPGAVTAIPGAVLSGSMDGHIRAFSAQDGRVIWDYDTQRNYETVNAQPGNGGSLDGAGAVVADGMLFINSGYPRQGGVPGNVLLAFGLDSSVP